METMSTDDPHGDRSPQDRQIIEDAIRLLKELDNTGLDEMTAPWYLHGFNELYLTLRDVLRFIGEDTSH
jgi:hypothetical protein